MADTGTHKGDTGRHEPLDVSYTHCTRLKCTAIKHILPGAMSGPLPMAKNGRESPAQVGTAMKETHRMFQVKEQTNDQAAVNPPGRTHASAIEALQSIDGSMLMAVTTHGEKVSPNLMRLAAPLL